MTDHSPLALVTAMTEAFQKGDLDHVMNTYEPGAKVMFEPGVATQDPAALRATFAQWTQMNPQFTYAGHEVIEAGGLAVHIAPWTMNGTLPDGTAIEQKGLSVAVLRQQEDGSWRMVIDNPHGSHLIPAE